jgi:RNA polymerase sigma-70 factor (ECF subfamily)
MFASEIDHWKCMLEGDQNAFLKIYNLHYRSLFRYGFYLSRDKELTKDCIQEVFLELWNNSAAVNKNVHDVKGYLFTWLRRKIHKAVSHSIKQKEKESNACPTGEELSYEELLIAFQTTEQDKERLTRALNNLTKKQLELIKLKYFDDLSYEQIACKTSLATRTIYNTIYEALRHLRSKVNVLA